MASSNQLQIVIPRENATINNNLPKIEEEEVDYSERSQWLRAAVLGANDGLVSIASLIMGVGAIKHDAKAMILTGFAGLLAGACSMAIGEFVSVYAQLDIEKAQMKRGKETVENGGVEQEKKDEEEKLPNPIQAAMASALAFSMGAIVPLLAAAFISNHNVRLGVVVAATTVGLVAFGIVGAVLGGTRVGRSSCRVVVGGWLAMAITFGLTKLIGSNGFDM